MKHCRTQHQYIGTAFRLGFVSLAAALGLTLPLDLMAAEAAVRTSSAEAAQPAVASSVGTVARQTKTTYRFEADGVRFHNEFPGARLNDCTRIQADEYRLTIRPENAPINNSAWYAFQVAADEPKTIRIRLSYENGSHRYLPQVSLDRIHWKTVDEALVELGQNKREATLPLDVGPRPLWVAGQEMLGREELQAWVDKLAKQPFAQKSSIGRSLEGRSIEQLQFAESREPRCVVLIGRQHPPEVTGSLGLMAFVERIAESDELAAAFRQAFLVNIVCLVNPDGVEHGHWRHNLNGVDLNRDWGSFRQPETRAVRDAVRRIQQEENRRLYLWIDFHSTYQDCFYTQPDSRATSPANFTGPWLDAIRDRSPGFSVRRIDSLGSKSQTSQQWSHAEFGVPSITFEWGDRTDRELIRQVARIAAEEMMRRLMQICREEADQREVAPAGTQPGR